MTSNKSYVAGWEEKWINFLADWYLKDYLRENPDYLKQAKIRITFNISVIPLFLFLPYLVVLIIHPIYYSLHIVSVTVITLVISLIILKVKKDYLLPAKLIVCATFLALSSDLLFSDTPALVDIIWYAVIIFYSYFTINRNWGMVTLFASAILSIYYIQFRLYDNFHDESIYSKPQINNITISTLIAFVTMFYITKQYLRLFAFSRDKIQESYDEVKEINKKLSESKGELEEANEELKNSNNELESFSYSVSHDLRAPLRSIEGFTSILKDDYEEKVDENGKRLMGLIIKSVDKMNKLIDDVLNLSRHSRQPIAKTDLNMNALVNSVIDDIKTADPEKKIEFDVKELVAGRGDLNLITQVLQNLLRNAVKFSSKVQKPKIEVGSYNEGNMNVYYIRDNGAGFDMAHAEKLFGVFHRLHSESEFEGTGIGLAIVKKIINRHGGQVWAEAKVGEGATFYFSLPVNGHKR